MPSVENRLKVLHEIREFGADLVFTHRPNDYHPDHRYTSKLVEDSAYLVMVPLVLPETPPLAKNPLFLYYNDPFRKPYKFNHDIVIDIDAVSMDKARALNCHQSQMWEWMPWVEKKMSEVEALSSEQDRLQYLLDEYSERVATDPEKQNRLDELYTKSPQKTPKYCESFECCEYGFQLGPEDIRKYFPMIQ